MFTDMNAKIRDILNFFAGVERLKITFQYVGCTLIVTKKMHCREQFLRTTREYSAIILRCSLFTCKLGLWGIHGVKSLGIFSEYVANMNQDSKLNM